MIKFEPRDIWVGVYWNWCREFDSDQPGSSYLDVLNIYVCLIPMFPIHFMYLTRRRN